jgi:hypothetical protein
MVIGTDCIGSCKSNYHTITATTTTLGISGDLKHTTVILGRTIQILLSISDRLKFKMVFFNDEVGDKVVKLDLVM